jgi:DNA-directed RNA polymerase specialized sigma24 family protein
MPRPVVGDLDALVDDFLPFVHGAAVAASSDPDAVAIEVICAAARAGAPFEQRAFVERALLLSVERAPARAFAAIALEDRGVVALARLAGYSVPEVATALGVDAATARARMLRGLRALGSAIERETGASSDKALG